MTTASEVISRFGGPAKLSRLLAGEIGPAGVSNWGQRDKIPGDWHLGLLALAEREGVELSADDLSTTKRRNGG